MVGIQVTESIPANFLFQFVIHGSLYTPIDSALLPKPEMRALTLSSGPSRPKRTPVTKQTSVTLLSVLYGSASKLQLLFLNSNGEVRDTVNHSEAGSTYRLRLRCNFSCDLNRKDKIMLELPNFRAVDPMRPLGSTTHRFTVTCTHITYATSQNQRLILQCDSLYHMSLNLTHRHARTPADLLPFESLYLLEDNAIDSDYHLGLNCSWMRT